jgi:hypothetical protein
MLNAQIEAEIKNTRGKRVNRSTPSSHIPASCPSLSPLDVQARHHTHTTHHHPQSLFSNSPAKRCCAAVLLLLLLLLLLRLLLQQQPI